MTFSNKLIVAVTLVTLVMAPALGVVVFYSARDVLRTSIHEHQVEAAHHGMADIDRILLNAHRDIQVIAGDIAIKVFLITKGAEAGAPDAREDKAEAGIIQSELEEKLLLTGPWETLMVLDSEGEIVSSLREGTLGKSIRDYEATRSAYHAVLKGRPYHSDLVRSEETGRPTVVFAAPVWKEKGGAVLGVVIGHFAWPSVLQIFDRIRPPGEAYLFNRDGVVIALRTGEKERILERSFSDLDLIKRAMRGDKAGFAEVTMESAAKPVLAAFAAQRGRFDYRGSGWGFLTTVPLNVVSRPVNDLARMIGTLVLLAIPIIAGIFYVIGKRMTQPIRVLTRTAQAVSEGDLSIRAEVTTRDEVGVLSRVFNEMIERLKASRDTLLSAQAYTVNIIKSMADSLIVINNDATIGIVNKATLDLLGYREEELIGKCQTRIFEETLEDGTSPFKAVRMKKMLLEEDVIQDYEMIYRTKSGERIPVNFSGSVMRDQEGKIKGLVAVARDIREAKRVIEKEKKMIASAQKRAHMLERAQKASLNIMEDLDRKRDEVEKRERQLKETQAMLVQAGKMTAMGQLGAGIAHELNQPIGAVRGFSQLLISRLPEDSALLPNLRIIEEQSRRMEKIVNNIRSFARDGKGEFEPVSLNQSIKDAVMLLKAQLHSRQITLDLKLQPYIPQVMADKNEMQQIFINLLINAGDAVEEKGGPGRIQIVTRSDKNGWVEARVTDSGRGISEDIKSRIFDPFFTTKPPGKGTGLGLSIVYGIVEKHKGRIKVESKEGEGATFIVRFQNANQTKEKENM